MRVKLRRKLVVDDSLDLSSITPWEGLIASIIISWRDQQIYKVWKQRKETEEYRKYQQRVRTLKNILLNALYSHLVKNQFLLEKSLEADSVTLEVSRKYEKELQEVLKSKDLDPFLWNIESLNSDMLNSFNNLPIFVTFRRRLLKEVK